MNYAQEVCDALDQLDTTPFGRMGEALDKISDTSLKASLERECMVAVLHKIRNSSECAFSRTKADQILRDIKEI